MHLAACFQTNQHVRGALSFFHLGGGNRSLTVGEPGILKCMFLFLSLHIQHFSLCRRRDEKGQTALTLKQGEWLCQTSQSLWKTGADKARPSQMPLGYPGCPQAGLDASTQMLF